MPIRPTVAALRVAVFLAAAMAFATQLVRAQAPTAPAAPAAPAPAAAEADEPVPTFAADFLRDTRVLATGREVWQQQCRHCHGNSAYPGKAPKLSPGGLDPVFIFDRVTYGFKGMPPWRHVFTREQRMAVVAYIKSDGFSP